MLFRSRSLESWPFHLLVKVAGKFHTYEPKSNFLLLNYDLPQLSVEVSSQGRNGPTENFIRLMLQGASIVRFANTKLDAYKAQKDFVSVAIYIDNSGKVDRYLLYQDEKIDSDNPENVRIHVRYISQNLMLNRRRFIGSFEHSISKMQTSARDLLLNCTTSLLHGVMINVQKKKSKNSRPLSRML